MKITIVVGGRWHAFDLARQLQSHGHLHRLITNYPRWYVTRWGIPAEKVVSLPLTFWVIKAIYKIGGEALMMRYQWRVHNWFAQRAVNHLEGSELIHGWSQWSEPSLKWARNRGITTVLERSSAHILEQSRLLREEYERLGLHWPPTHPKIVAMELKEYKLCTSIAVPSRFVERTFREKGVNITRLNRNALGVNLKQFEPPKEPPSPPIEVGLKVVYAGALSVQKGVPDLLNGFHTANLPNSTLTLLGGCTKELKPLLDAQPESVKRLGHRPQTELVRHYQTAHCFVIASIQEGMAMVQMQALACGLPIICSEHTGGEDLLRLQGAKGKLSNQGIAEFPAGFVVPIHKPEAIAYCLQRLQREPELWKGMREAALELANSELNWSAYGARAISHYNSLLKAK